MLFLIMVCLTVALAFHARQSRPVAADALDLIELEEAEGERGRENEDPENSRSPTGDSTVELTLVVP
jgi:hypothetical protein